MTKPRTLYDKIWDAHLVHEAPDGTCLLYIDRHLVHEVTSPQAFEGVCIARQGQGLNESFTVRKISYGEGVERVFPVHSPLIDSIEVIRRGRVRRAKLYYLRGRRGKAARIPERQDVRGKKKEAFKGFTKPKGEPDDLKLIAGITPELETKLNKLGVIKFEQIANLSDDDIIAHSSYLGSLPPG